MSGAVLSAIAQIPVNTLVAAVDHTVLYGFKYGKGTAQTDDIVTVTPSGGVAPYTYLWTRVSGDTATFLNVTTSPFVRFFRFMSSVPSFATATWKCTVTDSVATTADTPNVVITLEAR